MKRFQHATIDRAKVRAILKRTGYSQAELSDGLAAMGVRHFRLDRHGPGKTSANLDTVGGICKFLHCTPNDVVSLVGQSKKGLGAMGKE